MLRLSIVCCSKPCIRSTTKIATSQREEPRERRFVKLSWPGVSMTSIPGIFKPNFSVSFRRAVCCSSVFFSKYVAPICCVIPPASPSCTFVLRILSSNFVFPVSTCPIMTTMGQRKSSFVLAAKLAFSNSSLFCFPSAFFCAKSCSLWFISSCSANSLARCSASIFSRLSRSSPIFLSFSFSFLFSAAMRSSSPSRASRTLTFSSLASNAANLASSSSSEDASQSSATLSSSLLSQSSATSSALEWVFVSTGTGFSSSFGGSTTCSSSFFSGSAALSCATSGSGTSFFFAPFPLFFLFFPYTGLLLPPSAASGGIIPAARIASRRSAASCAFFFCAFVMYVPSFF
mmetsp:Transcript_24754/g.36303  ORF Transcript_24754/g.36303 Transcript_24754/m.36303 type:complete len:345 (-) Transcript_24754:560-1594(-)